MIVADGRNCQSFTDAWTVPHGLFRAARKAKRKERLEGCPLPGNGGSWGFEGLKEVLGMGNPAEQGLDHHERRFVVA